MSDLDVYARQGFGGQAGMGRAPALLIVDFANGFTDPEVFGGGNIGPAIAATVPMLAFCREHGIPVAHTRVVYAADGTDAGVFARKAPALRRLTEDNPLSHIVPELTPVAGELVVRKLGASAFFETQLASWLRFKQVDTLLIAGCTTSGCVRASVVDSLQHNFRTVVLTECVGDRAQGPHDANMFDMAQKYADLMDNAAVMAAIRAG
jgi:maleamate amidohydrolase